MSNKLFLCIYTKDMTINTMYIVHEFPSHGNCPILCKNNAPCGRVYSLVFYEINVKTISVGGEDSLNRVFQRISNYWCNRYVYHYTCSSWKWWWTSRFWKMNMVGDDELSLPSLPNEQHPGHQENSAYEFMLPPSPSSKTSNNFPVLRFPTP